VIEDSKLATFTAQELSKKPAKVYKACSKYGKVLIKHTQYPELTFELISRESGYNFKTGEKSESF